MPREVLQIPISALEHYSYCPRQCGLIHLEGIFEENLYTTRGRYVHTRVHEAEDTLCGDFRIVRSVSVWSERLGLQGRVDVLELRPEGPYPVEYKAGYPVGVHPNVQLCAQAICLEEMLGMAVSRGAVFHQAARRRFEVVFDETLRRRTLEVIAAVREMLEDQSLPPALNDSRCPNCSLVDACLPSVV